MELEWITPQQAAEKWGVSARRVQALCINGQINGTIKLGRVWLIPKDTLKPYDGKKNNGRTAKMTHDLNNLERK
jgi:excisionase family DNA binding protein